MPSHAPFSLPFRTLLLPLLLAGAPGCGGSATSPPPPPVSLEYRAVLPMPTANTVTLQEVSTSATSLVLDVVATDVSAASIFFDLVFRPDILRFDGAVEGTFFSSAGRSNFTFRFDRTSGVDDPGRVVVSASTLDAKDVAGTGAIARITLTKVGAGSTGVSFEAMGALRADFSRVPGLSFAGGTVTSN